MNSALALEASQFGEYVIVYWVESENVLILRVAHGRRDIDALFSQ